MLTSLRTIFNKLLGKLCVPGLICLFALLHSTATATERYGLCKSDPTPEASLRATPSDPDAATRFVADRAKRDEKGINTLEGTVRMTRGTQTVDADSMRYDENSKKVYASGNVRAEDRQLVIEAPEAELHLNTDYARSADATYQYKPMHARGRAKTLEQISPELLRFENATYTTCDIGDRSWELSADEVKLDKASGYGVGKDVLVKFKGIPIYYMPWIRFPIDDRRKTGFLTPAFGNSNDSGFELETPWYWNIAPNRDALFAPRLLTNRGLQLKSSFRYLNQKSFGHLGLEYLSDDEFNDNRYLFAFKHTSYLTPKIKLDLLRNKVSDDNYFEDLGDDLGLTSTQNIESRADLHYRGKHWRLLTRVQNFQLVDENVSNTSEPIQREPQIKLDGNYSNLPGGFKFSSENEWVSFAHDHKIDGDRLHFGVALERPLERTGYFVRPGVRFTHTEYDLNRRDGKDQHPSRSLPSVHLDAGLMFERNLAKTAHMQTLEPRIYYLHTPFRDQNDIPSFDSSEYEFGYEQLFRDNRFSGKDRIGDADHLSVGLTTRILDLESGDEKLSASLGRIFYFRDRKVALPNKPMEREPSSEVAAKLKISPNDRWHAIASTLWDTHDNHTEKSSVRFQYRSKNDFILNMSYRYRRRDIEQVDPLKNRRRRLEQSDISMVWPINNNWRAVSRWNYDLREKRDLELLAGIEYDTCCWKLRVAGRRYNQNTNEDYNNSIEVQLVLKGLGQIGSPIGELLERGILGYDARDDEYLR